MGAEFANLLLDSKPVSLDSTLTPTPAPTTSIQHQHLLQQLQIQHQLRLLLQHLLIQHQHQLLLQQLQIQHQHHLQVQTTIRTKPQSTILPEEPKVKNLLKVSTVLQT